MTTQTQEKTSAQIESRTSEVEKTLTTLIEQASGLVNLAQKQGEAVMEVVKKSLTMGAGAAELVQQEMEARVKEAIDKGREQAQSVAVLVESLGWMFKESVAQAQKTVEETVEKNLTRLLASMKIPTRKEMNQLKASLEQLSQQVEQLAKKKVAAKATKKKAAAKPKKAKKTPAKARKR